jgi:hypothetical protein
MITNFLQQADFLSYQPKLYTKGHERFRTVYGGLAQLILILLNIVGIIYFAKDIYQRTNPNVVQSSGKEVFKPPIPFLQKYSVFITVMDSSLGIPFRNDSIYQIKFYQNILDMKLGFLTTPLEAEVCNMKSFEEPIPDSVLDYWNLDQYTCIKKGQNATLKGSDMDLANWFISAKVTPCDRTVKGHKCGSEQEITRLLTGTKVQSFLIDKYFDANDFYNPVQYYIRMQVFAASLGYKNLAWSLFKTVNFIDDTGVLFTETSTNSVIAWDQTTLNFGPSAPGDSTIFEMYYQQGTTIDNITRRYKRLQEIVASVGGLLSVFFLFSRIFVVVLTEHMFFDYLFDSHFNYDLKEKKSKRPILIPACAQKRTAQGAISTTRNQNSSSEATAPNNNNDSPSRKSTSKAELIPVPRSKKLNKKNSDSPTKLLSTNTKGKQKTTDSKSKTQVKSFFKDAMNFDYFFLKFKEIELLKLLLLSEEQNSKFDKILKSKTSSEIVIRKFSPQLNSLIIPDEPFDFDSLVTNKANALEEIFA